MSMSFNKLLISPGEGDLVAALDAASRCPGESRGRDDWRPALDEVAENAEGRLQIESLAGESSRYVIVAWWSDHQGRKHVRVVGGNQGHGDRDLHHSRLDHDPRPPLWHVCPQRVFRVKRGDAEPMWLASCACGETGLAQELGWAGDRCGPCHDRREEGLAVDACATPWIDRSSPVRALAFDPAQSRLAISAEWLSIHDLAAGVETMVSWGGEDCFRPLAFSPDGRRLAGGDSENGVVVIWDTTGVSAAVQGFDIEVPPTGLGFSPDGRLLAVLAGDHELLVWEYTDVWTRLGTLGRANVFAFDFSPDSKTLAVGRDRDVVLLRSPGSLHERGRISFGESPRDAVHYLRFTPDGRDLVILAGNEEYPADAPWYLRRWNLALRKETHHAAFHPVSALDMTPDGRYLAYLLHDDQHSPAGVYFWDLQRWREAGWIEWNPDDVLRCLAFSADGRWLATGSNSGVVKLYPWRSLLEG